MTEARQPEDSMNDLEREFAFDRSHIEIVDSFEEGEARDRAYWQSQTPEKRMRYLEYLRRLNYGNDRCTARLQRVLEIAE